MIPRLLLSLLLPVTAVGFHARAPMRMVSASVINGVSVKGNLVPDQNFVLVKLRKADEQTETGFVLPTQAQEKPRDGEVVAAGPGKRDPETGVLLPTEVRKSVWSKCGRALQVVTDPKLRPRAAGEAGRQDRVWRVRRHAGGGGRRGLPGSRGQEHPADLRGGQAHDHERETARGPRGHSSQSAAAGDAARGSHRRECEAKLGPSGWPGTLDFPLGTCLLLRAMSNEL
eukprot:scaffold1178_cov252-Pinguiococcus_pyrenoidosus.AAC.24